MYKDTIVEIFTLVKELISDDTCSYVCGCIDILHTKRSINSSERKELLLEIQLALGDENAFVSSWLYKNHGRFYDHLLKTYKTHKAAYKAYRLAWCDAIIERGYI